MTHYYATLAQIKARINTALGTEDVPLLENSADISERIDDLMQSDVPFFLPYKETRAIEVDGTRVNSSNNSFQLGGYLLELHGVTLDGTALVVGTDVAGYPTNASPISALRLLSRCESWYRWCNNGYATAPPEINVNGIWGYHRRGSAAWKTVGTLFANINASITTMTVKDGATELSGESDSRFSAGCLFRIDDEYFTKLYTASGTQVTRAVNGTTAVLHTAGANVDVFQVERNIARVVARQSGLLLARRGAYDIRGSNEVGTPLVYPGDLLQELYGVMQGYAYL